MRAARWILGIAGAVVLLAVAAVLLATLVINPDRYRGNIENAVRRDTGRPFALAGHLRLTWYPWLGMRMGAARLGNPPGAAGPDLLDWRSAELRVRLLPLLLHHRLEVGRIRIVGADIHLRRGPRGASSWDDLIARLRPGGAASPWTITWAGLDLEQSSLEYVDERTLERVSLADWQLTAGPWPPAQPLSLGTSFVLRADTLGGHGLPVAAGTLHLPPDGVRVSLEVPRLQFATAATGPVAVSAPQWSLRVADAQLAGAIDTTRDAAGTLTASGSLTASVPSLRDLATTLGLATPKVQDPAALRQLSLSGNWSYRAGVLTLKPLTAKLDSTTLTGWAARTASPRPSWTFALRADQVDFGRYLTQTKEQKPPELPVSTLQALHAQGTLEVERARIGSTTLTDVRLQVQ
ncbi:MAG TPA: AsmA family protein [Steroidobacteraceae bacterium]|nr:AsmA family protein [Steroidobacteraceae bacterium]